MLACMQIPCQHMCNPTLKVRGTFCFPDTPFTANRWTTDKRLFFDKDGNLPADEEKFYLENDYRIVTARDTQASNSMKLK